MTSSDTAHFLAGADACREAQACAKPDTVDPRADVGLFGTSPVGVGTTGTGTAGRVTMSPVCLSGPADETRRDSESN